MLRQRPPNARYRRFLHSHRVADPSSDCASVIKNLGVIDIICRALILDSYKARVQIILQSFGPTPYFPEIFLVVNDTSSTLLLFGACRVLVLYWTLKNFDVVKLKVRYVCFVVAGLEKLK